MSILIRGMEMPKNCAECRFCVNGFTDDAPMYECACETYENVSVLVDDHGKPFDFRPDWCPLVSVTTPHGRLIDADELEKKMDERMDRLKDNRSIYEASCVATALDLFAPTIIGAEGSERQ